MTQGRTTFRTLALIGLIAVGRSPAHAAAIRLDPDWVAVGDQASGQFGVEVAGAGDVNGDGFDDVIVGAFAQTAAFRQQGAAYAFLGSRSGLGGRPAWTAIGERPNQHFGRAVRTAGDLDGDGFADVAVGAPTASNTPTLGPTPTAHVYRGASSGLSSAESWRIASPQLGDRLGRAVGTAGDVNGDGFDDIVVGAYFHDVGGITDNGGVTVYHGGAGGPSRHHNWIATFPAPGAGLGWGAATAGDVNGDGFADLIAGAPKYDTRRDGVESRDGMAFVWLGSPTGLAPQPAWRATVPDRGSDFGRSVASAGDVNGDGFDDVIVGARLAEDPVSGAPKTGGAFLYLGSRAGLQAAPAWSAYGENPIAHFGIYVAGAGDVNGDGFDDVVVGAPGTDRGRTAQGAIYIYLGSATGLSPSAQLVAEGGQDLAGLGFSAWAAGDVDGDGLADVVAGAPFFDVLSWDEGAALVYLGATISRAIAASVAAPSTIGLSLAAILVLCFARRMSGDGRRGASACPSVSRSQSVRPAAADSPPLSARVATGWMPLQASPGR